PTPARGGAEPHPDRIPTAASGGPDGAGTPGGLPAGGTGPAVAAATGGGSAHRPTPLAGPRCPVGAAPLRRQQRLLCARTRADHDVFLRSFFTRRRDARGSPGLETRTHLPQVGTARAHRDADARRRLRLGHFGPP